MKNLEVMVILFIIVILGYVACKLGYMGDKFDKKLSSMVVDITCPLLVLSSVMGDELVLSFTFYQRGKDSLHKK